eukprot:5361914-Prymnesium_polylepis.1
MTSAFSLTRPPMGTGTSATTRLRCRLARTSDRLAASIRKSASTQRGRSARGGKGRGGASAVRRTHERPLRATATDRAVTAEGPWVRGVSRGVPRPGAHRAPSRARRWPP